MVAGYNGCHAHACAPPTPSVIQPSPPAAQLLPPHGRGMPGHQAGEYPGARLDSHTADCQAGRWAALCGGLSAMESPSGSGRRAGLPAAACLSLLLTPGVPPTLVWTFTWYCIPHQYRLPQRYSHHHHPLHPTHPHSAHTSTSCDVLHTGAVIHTGTAQGYFIPYRYCPSGTSSHIGTTSCMVLPPTVVLPPAWYFSHIGITSCLVLPPTVALPPVWYFMSSGTSCTSVLRPPHPSPPHPTTTHTHTPRATPPPPTPPPATHPARLWAVHALRGSGAAPWGGEHAHLHPP